MKKILPKKIDNMKLLLCMSVLGLLLGCKEKKYNDFSDAVIARGEMPAVAAGRDGALLLTFTNGDSILSMRSSDEGKNFATIVLVDTLKDLVGTSMRGPQIAATSAGFAMIACDKNGNIFSYTKMGTNGWRQTARINDVDTVAKEGFLGLAGNGRNDLFAVWLDLRSDQRNKIFGASSTDGGRSWSKNILVYASPSGAVCDCCKPSVSVNGKNVFVMFRNNLDGNRDIYLIHSADGGSKFEPAEKMGKGSWKLDGCPMDGGGMAFDRNDVPQTVWNRKGTIYASSPGIAEKAIGSGRSCTITAVDGKNIYAWQEDGEVTVLMPNGIKKKLGKGKLPVLKALNNRQVLCVWENNNEIHRAVMTVLSSA